jgi:hypothetical protein
MMRNHPVYTVFASLVLLLLVTAEVRGWSITKPTEVLNVPRTVRDNPGSYRPIYLFTGSGRNLRGK